MVTIHRRPTKFASLSKSSASRSISALYTFRNLVFLGIFASFTLVYRHVGLYPTPAATYTSMDYSIPSPPPKPALIPRPQSISMGLGQGFEIGKSTKIAVGWQLRGTPAMEGRIGDENKPAEAFQIAQQLADLLPGEVKQMRFPAGRSNLPNAILLSIDADAKDELGEEGYELFIKREAVTLRAHHHAGLFYGVQTLRQLLPPSIEKNARRSGATMSQNTSPLSLPPCKIFDRPRFAWRGLMLDVARHFLPVDSVKTFLDHMVLYKLNVLHLHLTDDQGWRIEVPKWPKLHTHGSKTAVGGKLHSGYYTTEQYDELVQYASERHVTIVPEIDCPGHTNAALSSYAELNCNNKATAPYTGTKVEISCLCTSKNVTYQIWEDIIDHVSDHTPGPFVHIGGDEVITLAQDGYETFLKRISDIVASKGKRMIGWDDVAETMSLPADAVVQLWRPSSSLARDKERAESLQRGLQWALKKGSKVVASPADRIYIDMKYSVKSPFGLHWAGYINSSKSYNWEVTKHYDPLVKEEDILGLEAALWSETVVTLNEFQTMAFPRLPGVAELAWSPLEGKDWDEYKKRLAAQEGRWSALGINFYRDPAVPWTST